VKITDPKAIAQPAERPSAAPAPRNGATAPAAPGRIEISALSSRLSSLEAELAASPEFDQGRVDAIKEAIRSGQFRINAEAIADKLLAGVHELLKRPH
jgi:negative regulator of flagellin synthesis FlgM